MGIRNKIGNIDIRNVRPISWAAYWAGQDLNTWMKSRDELSLVDDFGNDASILLPHYYNAAAVNHQIYYADNGDLDVLDADFTAAIWFEDTSVTDAARYLFGKVKGGNVLSGCWSMYTHTDGKLYVEFQTSTGQKYIGTPNKARTYGKSLILLEIDNTAKVIRMFLNNAQIGVDTAFDGTISAVANEYETCVACANNAAGSGYGQPFLGSLADAWIFKKKLTAGEKTILYNKGVISGAEVHWLLDGNEQSGGVGYDSSGNERHLTSANVGVTAFDYSSLGSRQGLNIGYDIWLQYGTPTLYVPYTDAGASTVAAVAGYTKYGGIAGNAGYHNSFRSKILFSQAFMDRSDVTIYSAKARYTIAGNPTERYFWYNAGSPNEWHIEEINQEAFDLFFNTDYKDRIFVLGNNNAYDTDKNLREILIVDTKRTGSTLNKALQYIERPYRTAGAVFTFDDLARIASWNKYDEEKLKWKYGWKMEACVNAANEATLTAQATRINRLVGRNHGISNHTVNHIDWEAYIAINGAQQYYDVEVAPLKGWLTTLLGDDTTYAYCQVTGENAALNTILLAAGYTLVRPAYYEGVELPAGMYDGSSQVAWCVQDSQFVGNETAFDFFGYANTNNVIFIFVAHTIGETEAYQQISIARLETYLQYCIDNKMKFYRMDELLPGLFT